MSENNFCGFCPGTRYNFADSAGQGYKNLYEEPYKEDLGEELYKELCKEELCKELYKELN